MRLALGHAAHAWTQGHVRSSLSSLPGLGPASLGCPRFLREVPWKLSVAPGAGAAGPGKLLVSERRGRIGAEPWDRQLLMVPGPCLCCAASLQHDPWLPCWQGQCATVLQGLRAAVRGSLGPLLPLIMFWQGGTIPRAATHWPGVSPARRQHIIPSESNNPIRRPCPSEAAGTHREIDGPSTAERLPITHSHALHPQGGRGHSVIVLIRQRQGLCVGASSRCISRPWRCSHHREG